MYNDNTMQAGLALIEKAWTSGLSSSDAGSVLLQPVIDTVIPIMADYESPARQNIPRKPGAGSAYKGVQATPGNTPWAGVTDTDTIAVDQSSYAALDISYKTLAATKGKVTRFLQATGRSYIDVLLEEMEVKMYGFQDGYEYWLINGVSSTTQIDGLQVLIPSSQEVLVTTTAGGDDLTLAKMDEFMDKGKTLKLMFMSYRTRRELNALLQSTQRYVNLQEIKGGFKVLSYNGVPILISTQMLDTQTFDGSGVTSQTGGTASSILGIDTNHVFVSELTPVTSFPCAKTTSQYDEFEIFSDFALVVRNYLRTAKLTGIWDRP